LHFPALTGFRFFLAIWVILHHLSGKGKMLDAQVRVLPECLQTLISSGYLAVATFFVLSGFVLARSYGSTRWNRPNLIRYAAARGARVYPVYLVSLIILAPIIYEQLTPERTDALWSYALVLQGWGHPSVNWNTPAWSLSCELFFYALFPLVLIPLRRAGRRRFAVAAVAGFAMPFALMWMRAPSDWKPVIHLSDFLMGIAASAAYDMVAERMPRMAGRGWVLYAPAAIMGLAAIVAPSLFGPWWMHDAVLRVANAAMLTGLAFGGGFPARALSTELSVFLGKASYSMYILHVPLLWWFKRTWVYQSAPFSVPGTAAVYIGGVIAVSAVVFRHVEEPWNRRIRNWVLGRVADRAAPITGAAR
jgi:peptidoglycan/LPS O-acetylase OafA/YrhL